MGACPSALYEHIISDLEEAVPAFRWFARNKHPCPPDGKPKLAAAIALRDSTLKKLRVKNTRDADNRCLLKFLTTNLKCEKWAPACESSKVEELAMMFKDIMHRFFDPDEFPDDFVYYFKKGRTGPGVTLSSSYTDMYTKLYGDSVSAKNEGMYLAYKLSCAESDLQIEADIVRNKLHGPPRYSDVSRLSFVAKNDVVSRSICIEPTLSMVYQLGVGGAIERRLARFFGIDLKRQAAKNRRLSRYGSITGEIFTCDLSSASDSISVKMCEAYLPRYVNSILHFGRSTGVVIPAYGLQVPLAMVSTMGNGFTFPLQTAIFASALLACYRFRGVVPIFPHGKEWGNFGVFGDDIAGDSRVYRDLVQLLNHLGFEINEEKSFNEGNFRESCGQDHLNGVNIRGVYVKTLDTPQDAISVVNELNLFSSRTGIPLKRAVQYLVKRLGKYVRWVPMHESSASGIRVPLNFFSRRRKLDSNNSYIYYRWEAEAAGYSVGELFEISFFGKCDSRKVSFNPQGMMLAYLAGHVRNGKCVVRHDHPVYRSRKCVTPCWDNTLSIQEETPEFNWRRFGNAAYVNLFG